MVFWAAAIAIIGVFLKLITAEPAGWFLVPLAAAAAREENLPFGAPPHVNQRSSD
jgi:hypothetical protein